MTSTTGAAPADVATRAELARRLTELREAGGLTVRAVARRTGLPVATVGGWLSGRHLPPMATIDQFERVLVELGVPADAVPDWVEVVARLRRTPGRRPAAAPAPYRGLAAYQVDDAALFVGREAATTALVERVIAQPATPVVVLGASGAGKSSLLRAGLVATLRARGVPAVVMTPGEDPEAALAAALVEVEEVGVVDEVDGRGAPVPGPRVLVVDQLEEALLAAPRSGPPHHPAERALHPAEPALNPAESADRTEGAAGLVARLAAVHAAGTTVVLGLRADVFERALADEVLAGWLAAHQVLVGPLSGTDLRRVVVEPAAALGLDVEPALVEAVAAEATAGSSSGGPTSSGTMLDAGVLPLVSHALYATWAASSGRALTLAGYRAVGGLAGAIAQTGERVVADLTPDRLDAVRRALLNLVHVRDGAADTRRVASQADLTGPDEAAVVAALVDARLLTVDLGQVQLAHEALLSSWPRLRAWIEADRDALRVHSRLAEAARHWDEAARDDDLLYRGAALDAATAWAADGRSPAGGEREFLAASTAAAHRNEAARRRSTRRLRALAASLAVLAVSTGGLAVTAVAQGRASVRERDVAVSRQLAVTAQSLAGTDPALGAQLAAAALVTADTVEARSALLSASGTPASSRLATVDGLVNHLDVSPDGSVLAVATDRSRVLLWSTGDDPRMLADLPVDDTALYGLTFSADGSLLAAGGDGGTLHLWSVADPEHPTEVAVSGPAQGGTLYGLATDAAGTLLAGAVSDGTVQLWRLGADGATAAGTIAAFGDGTAQAVVLDGDVLVAAGSQGLVSRWDVGDPDRPVALGEPVAAADGQINALALSPDGHTLAAGSADTFVHLLDLTDPTVPVVGLTLAGPASWVNDVAFSPDGTRLAAAGSDKTLWVWDPATGAAAGTLAHPTTLLTAQWSRDGDLLFSGGADGVLREWAYPGSVLAGFSSIPGQGAFGDGIVVTASTDGIRVWDAHDPTRFGLLGSAPAPEGARLDGAVDVSDALHLVVAGDTTGSVHAWDITDPSAPVLVTSVHAHTDWVDTVTFDASGTRLAASSDDGSVTLWDLSDGVLGEPTARVDDLGGAVYVVAFSPDASTLVASVLSGSVRLIDVRDPAHPALVGDPITGPTGYVYSAAFSPDGRTVAASGNDGTLWLWDVTDPTAPVALGNPLRWAEGYGTNTAFSPDGSLVAVAMTDGTVRVWNLADREHPSRWAALSGAQGTVYGVEFSPDGTHLSAAAADRTVRVWDVTIGGALDLACTSAGRGVAMTDAEWLRIAGDVRRPSTCS